MAREAGVLLHITSLPGKYGIGKLGLNALSFASMLADCGFSWWQVLPFGPPAAGYSPYQCYSAYAGNPMLIDPEWLFEHDLLTADEVASCKYHGSPHSCDFVWLESKTDWMLRQAYKRAGDYLMADVQTFTAVQKNWLPDYAVYMTLRTDNDSLPWWQWADERLRRHEREAIAAYVDRQTEEVNYHCFVQYIFDLQWQETREAIHELGIRLIGDMPIYVSADSSDVWANSELFELDENLRPIRIAGVPPDYFTEEGQLWGNPLYDWQVHNREDYRWWRQRVAQSLQWFDKIRLDHFRGFSAYWAVPADAKNAIKGEWVDGPGTRIFDFLFADFGREVFIAEDLGEIDEAVDALLKDINLPGMRVLQFGFDPDSDSTHLPCFYPRNCVAYTGTHDNNTILGWLWDIDERQRRFALDYIGFYSQEVDWGQGGPDARVIRAFVRTVWATAAELAVVPVQDLLGYGGDTRMNTPGLGSDQWRYRVTAQDLDRIDQKWLLRLNTIYRRGPQVNSIMDITKLK